MGLQVALGKAIRPLPVRGRPEPSQTPWVGLPLLCGNPASESLHQSFASVYQDT